MCPPEPPPRNSVGGPHPEAPGSGSGEGQPGTACTPGAARAAFEAGELESALAALELARQRPESSRMLRALWSALEQDIKDLLVARARSARALEDWAAAARWLGLLVRVDPEAASVAERSFARAMEPPALRRAPDRSRSSGPPPGSARSAAREAAPRAGGPAALHGPSAPPIEAPPNAHLARLLADEVGELLLVDSPALFFGGAALQGGLPLRLPVAPASAAWWIEPRQTDPGGQLEWFERDLAGVWKSRGPLSPGQTLCFGPLDNPWARAVLHGPEPGAQALPPSGSLPGASCQSAPGAWLLRFERGIECGQASGLLWGTGAIELGRSAGATLRASALHDPHRLAFEGGRIALSGPGPIHRRCPAVAPGATDSRSVPWPLTERAEFEIGARRPPLWLRLDPLEGLP